MREKRLYRCRDDKVLMGLCAGIAKYFRIDPTLVRIAFIILEVLTAGLLIFFYFLIALFVPKEPVSNSPTGPQ